MNRALFALILPVFAAAACGGSVYETGDDTGGGGGDGGTNGGDSGGGGGGDGGLSSYGCPTAEPSAGGACSPSGIQCEYGSNNGACGDPLVTCTSGQWKYPDPIPVPACLPHDICPAAKSSIVVGTACGNQDEECNFPDGRCTCGFSGGLVQVFPDGGGAEREWQCEQPASGCPAIRPRIGSACTQANQSCDYGDCAMPDSVDIECVGGVWQNEPYACAG